MNDRKRAWRKVSPVAVLRAAFAGICDDSAINLQLRLIGIYGILGVLNFGTWAWALIAFHDKPSLLGTALLVYGLGLRHAIDADHVAAIDNVTRKLIGENKRPVSVGFFFAIGHSTVVIIVAAAVAGAVKMLGVFESFGQTGAMVSSVISSLFLFAIAAANIAVFLSISRAYRQMRTGGAYTIPDLDSLLDGRGILTRMFRSLFRLVTKSWHMFPLGALFGLGFDTATEVAMFGLTAAQAADGMALHTILIFPLLFAAGMALVDTIDGVLMLQVYSWALVEPMRKIRYNLVITLLSAAVAIIIGASQTLNLVSHQLGLSGWIWDGVSLVTDNLNMLGFLIIGTFMVAWALFFSFSRYRVLHPVNQDLERVS